MSVPQPLDNDKHQFITTKKEAEASNKKVVEFRQQKPESTVYLVSCWLAAKASENWLKSPKYPLTKQQALRLLGLDVEDCDNEEEREELLKFLERQRLKKYKTITNYREELDLLNDIKRADSRKIGSLINELEIRLESLYKDSSVNVDLDGISNRGSNWHIWAGIGSTLSLGVVLISVLEGAIFGGGGVIKKM